MTVYWAQLLHFYQPPTQKHAVLRKVADESYRPVIAVLMEHPEARIAVNVQGVLAEMLHEHGMDDILEGFRALGERGQVEFLGSAKYHPILPLIPERERVRSVADNAAVTERLLDAPSKGFFPPELCYSPEIVPAIAAAGYEWFVAGGVAAPGPWPMQTVERVQHEGHTLNVLYRDDARSNRISFRETDAPRFVYDLESLDREGDAYVLTAMDGETYGHHLRDWEAEFLAATYELLAHPSHGGVKMATPSEVVKHFPAGAVVEPRPSSWSTTEGDLAAQDPYPLWRSPGNRIHSLQWEYVDHVFDALAVARTYAGEGKDANRWLVEAEEALQPGLHSCQFWWASRRPMWDVSMIRRGFNLLNDALLYAVKSVEEGSAPPETKQQLSWRAAAAGEIRAQLERTLFLEPGP